MDPILDIVARDKFLGKLAKHHQIVSTLKQASQKILGQLHATIRIVDIREACLIFETENPIWVSEIRRYEKMILQRTFQVLSASFGKEYPQISRIKLILSRSVSTPINRIQHAGYNVNKAVDLETLILEENKKKVQSGWRWCQSCEDVLTETDVCAFCRSSGSVQTSHHAGEDAKVTH